MNDLNLVEFTLWLRQCRHYCGPDDMDEYDFIIVLYSKDVAIAIGSNFGALNLLVQNLFLGVILIAEDVDIFVNDPVLL